MPMPSRRDLDASKQLDHYNNNLNIIDLDSAFLKLKDSHSRNGQEGLWSAIHAYYLRFF